MNEHTSSIVMARILGHPIRAQNSFMHTCTKHGYVVHTTLFCLAMPGNLNCTWPFLCTISCSDRRTHASSVKIRYCDATNNFLCEAHFLSKAHVSNGTPCRVRASSNPTSTQTNQSVQKRILPSIVGCAGNTETGRSRRKQDVAAGQNHPLGHYK